jgi:hypothetical protein
LALSSKEPSATIINVPTNRSTVVEKAVSYSGPITPQQELKSPSKANISKAS